MTTARSRLARRATWALTISLLAAAPLLWRARRQPPGGASEPTAYATDTRSDIAAAPHAPRVLAAAPASAPPVATTGASDDTQPLGLAPPMREWRALFTELELGVEGVSLEDHLARARRHLREQYEAAEAERLAAAYEDYARYQLAIESAGAGPEADASDRLADLAKQRAIALRMLSPELAEATVLPRLRRREYLLQREAVFENPETSVAEKQTALAALQPPGPDAAPLHASPLATYREQLRLNATRLREATPDERARLLAELRERTLGIRLPGRGDSDANPQ